MNKISSRRNSIISFRQNLKAYMNACFLADMHDRAHKSLFWYRSRFMEPNKCVQFLDKSVFNVILKGWADVGNISRLNEVLDLMNDLRIPKDIHTYARLILCYFNQERIDLAQIDSILSAMKRKNINPSDILRETNLNCRQKNKIREYFAKIDPTLRFKADTIDYNYSCSVLDEFLSSPKKKNDILEGIDLTHILEKLNIQKYNELVGSVQIQSIYKPQESEELLRNREKLNGLLSNWRQELTKAFNDKCISLNSYVENIQGINMYPYLKTMEPSIYVEVMMETLENYVQYNKHYSPPSSFLYYEIGKRISNIYLSFVKSKFYYQTLDVFETFINDLKKTKVVHYSSRIHFLRLANEKGYYINSDLDEIRMPLQAILFVGRFLQDIMKQTLKIDSNFRSRSKTPLKVPIIYNVHLSTKDSLRTEIRINLYFHKLYQAAKVEFLRFPTFVLPTLVPPLPWLSVDTGGYILNDLEFIKCPDSNEEGLFSMNLAKEANINPVFDALNILSAIPWKINERVLDVLTFIFQNNGDLELNIPLHSSKLEKLPVIHKGMNHEEKIFAKQKRYRIKKANMEMYSLWCDTLYKLSIANHFRGKTFWFPHNLDFRGRTYASPPHFNHLGNDVSRSLLLFAKGKPLGRKGLDWLKIHLINLTGLKKREPLEARLAYANEIMPYILDSASSPLNGKKWWMKSEEPWQTLACCFEISDALNSPDTEKHICYYPIHQDGSCNGLQHYAALGRDLEGAKSVNLLPSEEPNDLYSDVASLVEECRKNDAKNGNEVAKYLEGFITRKVIKQTVMTYVYGVTIYGANLQILKQLKDLKNFSPQYYWSASIYLTKSVFHCIAQMFQSTQKIQFWFIECARAISKNLIKPVQWITPLGFPVIQPYFKSSYRHLSVEELHDPLAINIVPNALKQKNAFPPNFIHSLDSTHMMLTALHADREGINFVAVHDSYWTHPCDVDKMNKICREQFINLHSLPILHNLSNYFIEQYGPHLKKGKPETDKIWMKKLFKSVPKQGSFEINKVINSKYFFS